MFQINAVGIIAEYNPFHNGHYWHVSQAKQNSGCEYAIAVMSGQFTQRGEPAGFDKWTRAAMAVWGGVDLVLELPTVFTVRSAQYFATAGVQLLDSLGVVSHLAFGAEDPDQNLLQQTADLNNDQLGAELRKHLTGGVTYAAALAHCLTASGASLDVLSQPNNILAIEYLRAIKRFARSLTPVIIPRRQSHYHDTEITSPIASASAVRQALLCGNEASLRSAVPESSMSLIQQRITAGSGPVTYDSFSAAILYKLRTIALADLAQLPDLAEGLHYKLAAEALRAVRVEDLLTQVKSKRYTRTRLQRTLIHALLGITKQHIAMFDECGPLYARVLAFNTKGRRLLKRMSESSSVPVITKLAHFLNTKQRSERNLPKFQEMLAFDTVASDIYFLGAPSITQRLGAADFHQSPIYIDQ